MDFFLKKVLENELSVRLIFVMPYSEAYSKNAGKRGRKKLLWQLNLSTWPCWMDFLKKYSWKWICIQNGYGPFWVFDSYFSYLILKSTVLGLVLVEHDAESCASDATWLMIVDGIIKSVLMASKKNEKRIHHHKSFTRRAHLWKSYLCMTSPADPHLQIRSTQPTVRQFGPTF